MDNISIVIQDSKNPITIQYNSEFNSVQDSQPVFIHKKDSNGNVEIIDLFTWNNDIGSFSADLTNSNTYDPAENIFYSYTGNSNHVEIVRISEIDSYTLPVIYFLESTKFYYGVNVFFEKKMDLTHKDLVERMLNVIVTNPENYVGEIYLNRFPDPTEFRDILHEVSNEITPQFDSNVTNFITGYIKIVYNIYKVYPEGPDQIVKSFETSLILIPPVNTSEDLTLTKIIGIDRGYDEQSPSQIQDVICLKRESTVNVINGKYIFNGLTSYSNDLFGVNEGRYIIKNIPKEHPMAIINKAGISLTYHVDNKNPIVINVSPKLDPGNFSPDSVDHFFTFKINNQSIYLSYIPGITVFNFMRNRSYIFKTDNIDNQYFYIKIKTDTYTISNSSSIYVNIPGDLEISDQFEAGLITYIDNVPVEDSNAKTRLNLLLKAVDNVIYDFVYGNLIIDIGQFNESDNYTLSALCFYHGYMGAQDKFIFDKSCSKIIYNLVKLVDSQKFYFDITNKANLNSPQDSIDGQNYGGYHNIYTKHSVISTDFQLVGNYNYLFLDLNYTIDYAMPGNNISIDPSKNFPFKLLLDNSTQQTMSNPSEGNDPYSGIDSLNLTFLNQNFRNFFTSVVIPQQNESSSYSYTSRVPLVISRQLDIGMPNINFLFFKYKPTNITFLHGFNASEIVPIDLLGYDALKNYNPIYRADSSYAYIIQSYGDNSVSIDFNNIENYLILNGSISININKLSELELQVIQNDAGGDIVIPNPILKIYRAYYTNEEDEIFEFPNNLDIINLVKSNNYLNLKLSLSYEDDKGNISIFPSDLNNLNLYYSFINSTHVLDNDDPGLTFTFKDTNTNIYPINEAVNHHNMFQTGFVYPPGTGSYGNINVDDIGNIELMSSHIQQPIYSNVRLNMTSITYYNGVNINKLPISQQTYEIINQIADTENIHLLIKLDSIYKYDLKALKMFTLIRGNPQFDVYSNVILSSNFLENDIPILSNDEPLVDTGLSFEYKTLSLLGSTNNNIGYFDNVTLKIKISSHTEPTQIYSLGFLNHLFITFQQEPLKLTGISNNIYNSYEVYKDLIPKPELKKFTYYLSNDLSVVTNNLEEINTPITISGATYNKYKIALVDNNFSISNFYELSIPLIFLKKDENVTNISFNGNILNFSSNQNDIISIGNGLSLIVLKNDTNLLEVKIADAIDLIDSITTFISTIETFQPSDKEGLSRAYSKINSIYSIDNDYDNCPVIIRNKPDIINIIEKACEFLEDKQRFNTMYFIPITSDTIILKDISEAVRYESIIFLPMNEDDNEVNINIKGNVFNFKQIKSDLIVKNRQLKLGESTIINNIKIKNIGFGSLYLLLSNNSSINNTVQTGIGGDPYMSNLQGLKYKIPSSNCSYNYIDNCESNNHNRFIINFKTYVLEGAELENLNDFIINQLMIKNGLNSKKEVAIWLLKNNFKLDINACFIKEFYIKNGNNEFIFNLQDFNAYDLNGVIINNLPKRFNPVKSKNFNMVNQISEHIKLNDYKPYKGLKIQTETTTFGTVTIEFMKYHHPQIRNNINITFEKNPISTNSIGGIVKNRHYILDDISSYPGDNNLFIKDSITEIYVGNNGKIKLEKIKQ